MCADEIDVASAKGIHCKFHWLKHETISLTTVKSASVSSAYCPRSISAFCTGPRNSRNLASISTRLLHPVLQSKMTAFFTQLMLNIRLKRIIVLPVGHHEHSTPDVQLTSVFQPSTSHWRRLYRCRQCHCLDLFRIGPALPVTV